MIVKKLSTLTITYFNMTIQSQIILNLTEKYLKDLQPEGYDLETPDLSVSKLCCA